MYKCPKIDELKLEFENLLRDNKLKPFSIENSEIPETHKKVIRDLTSDISLLELNLNEPGHTGLFRRSGWIYLGLIDSLEINAFAYSKNELNIIGLNIGLIFSIKDLFYSIFSTKEYLNEIGDSTNEEYTSSDFLEYYKKKKKLEEYFQQTPKCPIRKKAADLFVLIAIKFTYYHELGHIIDCHTTYFKNTYGFDQVFEYIKDLFSKDIFFDKRSLETSADAWGSRMTLQLLNIFSRDGVLDFLNNMNPYNAWANCLETFFKFINPNKSYHGKEFGTHPNHFIRMWNIYYQSHFDILEFKLEHISNEEKISDLALSSVDLQKEFFNKINFTPNSKSSFKENQRMLKKYQTRVDFLIKNRLNKLIRKKIEYNEEELKRIKDKSI